MKYTKIALQSTKFSRSNHSSWSGNSIEQNSKWMTRRFFCVVARGEECKINGFKRWTPPDFTEQMDGLELAVMVLIASSDKRCWWEPGITETAPFCSLVSSKWMRRVKVEWRISSGGQTLWMPFFCVHEVNPSVGIFSTTLIGTSWCQLTAQFWVWGLSK